MPLPMMLLILSVGIYSIFTEPIFELGHLNQFKCDNRPCDLCSLGNYQNNLKLSQNVSYFCLVTVFADLSISRSKSIRRIKFI